MKPPIPEFQVDLSNCDREPIHLSGAIQPHGFLFVLQPESLEILQVSTNTGFFGHSPQQMLGRPLGDYLDDSAVEFVRASASKPGRSVHLFQASTREGLPQHTFDLLAHRVPEGWIVELEPATPTGPLNFGAFYDPAHKAIVRLQSVTGVVDLCNRAVQEVRALTGFDRVMAYRFDRHDNGHVIAEDKREDLESYLDLHYPASDIPAQARRLYVLNRLRTIVDVPYEPAPILPAVSPLTNAPLDLSYCVLRSVSPIHVEYLQNMGISASMSISLVIDDRLWGLLICHHYAPKFVPHDLRAACELLSQTLSWQIAASERSDRMERRVQGDDCLRHLLQRVSEGRELEEGLSQDPDSLLKLVDAAGAALVHAGRTTLFGTTPPRRQVEQLAHWLRDRNPFGAFTTEKLAEQVPEMRIEATLAAGLLAVRLDHEGESCLIWFRPEVVQTVNWAGDPNKVASLREGAPRLSPRGSFALWKETVRGQSLPWQAWQSDIAVDLAHAIASIVLKRAVVLAKLNRELEAATEALRSASMAKDEFLATISHELRNPLNAMLGWLRLLRYDELDTARRSQAVEVVERNAKAQAKLIDDLLDVSRIISGKMRLDVQAVNLLDIVQSAVDSVKPSAEARSIKLHSVLDPRASLILGDAARLQQIVWNLLSNAIKFTPKGGRVHVHLIHNESSASITISDNGEGIDPDFLPFVFERFRQAQSGSARIHQGLGLGLAIVRHLVELHGGTVSAFSEGRGRGAVFTVNVPLAPIRSQPEPALAPHPIFCPPQLVGLRVLLVEDEPDARELLIAELGRCGISVVAVASAAEGLEVLASQRPDVLISDLGMPQMDGFAFIKAVRQRPESEGGRTPAIALTGYASSQDRARTFLAGFQAHLPKPIEPGELFAVLTNVSGRSNA